MDRQLLTALGLPPTCAVRSAMVALTIFASRVRPSRSRTALWAGERADARTKLTITSGAHPTMRECAPPFRTKYAGVEPYQRLSSPKRQSIKFKPSRAPIALVVTPGLPQRQLPEEKPGQIQRVSGATSGDQLSANAKRRPRKPPDEPDFGSPSCLQPPAFRPIGSLVVSDHRHPIRREDRRLCGFSLFLAIKRNSPEVEVRRLGHARERDLGVEQTSKVIQLFGHRHLARRPPTPGIGAGVQAFLGLAP